MNLGILFLTVFSIVALGYVFKAVGILKEEYAEGLTRVILNITLPAVVLRGLSNFTVRGEFFLLPVALLAYSLIIFTLSLVYIKRRRSSSNVPLLQIALLGYNIGLFAYPIIEAIYGTEGLSYAIIIDLGNALVIFGLAYIICVYDAHTKGRGEGSENRGETLEVSLLSIFSTILKRLFTFLPFVVYIVALTIALTNVTLPGPLVSILDVLAKANMGLVLILLGMTFNLRISRGEVKTIVKILAVRYLAGGAAGILLFYLLPFDPMVRVITLTCFVLPAGMAIIPYSIEFGYNRSIASAVVNVSNLISFGLIFLVAWLIPV